MGVRFQHEFGGDTNIQTTAALTLLLQRQVLRQDIRPPPWASVTQEREEAPLAGTEALGPQGLSVPTPSERGTFGPGSGKHILEGPGVGPASGGYISLIHLFSECFLHPFHVLSSFRSGDPEISKADTSPSLREPMIS